MMQAADVGHVIEQLKALMGAGPGSNPEALSQAEAILARIRQAATLTTYTAEKVAAVADGFRTWLSAGGGQKALAVEEFRSNLQRDIDKLRHALARRSEGQD
jgi:hypothetical protein